jgi:hypothetical protein
MTQYTDLCEQADKALQGVTEGPWAVRCDPCHYDTASDVKSDCGNLFAMVGGGAKWQEQEANARFIAFARAWVPEAAAALTALSAEADALKAQVAELTTELDELRSKFKNVVSHATMGQTCDADLSLNQISVMITRIRNDWYADKQAAEAKVARFEGALSDPVAVHANMLRGTIAKPTVEQIIHIYGADALRAALTEGETND